MIVDNNKLGRVTVAGHEMFFLFLEPQCFVHSTGEWYVKKLKPLYCDFLLHCGRKTLGQNHFIININNNKDHI